MWGEARGETWIVGLVCRGFGTPILQSSLCAETHGVLAAGALRAQAPVLRAGSWCHRVVTSTTC